MNLVKYSISEFKNKQNIKCLLEKLGLPKELWDNNGQNFWNQSRLDLLNILEIAKKYYKNLAKQLHPRKLEDLEEESKKLHSLWSAIEKRFNYKLNKEKIVNVREGMVECECGCGKSFPPMKLNTGQTRRFFTKECGYKFRSKSEKKQRRLENPRLNPNCRDLFPLVTCKCGCGTRFRAVPPNNGKARKFASKQCGWRYNRSLQAASGKKQIYASRHMHKDIEARRIKREAALANAKIIKCARPECEATFRELNDLLGKRVYCSPQCKNIMDCRKRDAKKRERHENFKKILNGEI